MNRTTYTRVTTVIFLIIAVLHGARIYLGWDASINGWMVPGWISWVAIVVLGFLAYTGFNLNKKV